jgi:hypothetical protein
MEIYQYVIDEEAYYFWKQIERINIDSDRLFSQMPYHVVGNVYNVNDPDEPVLGYFLTAGVSKLRILVEPSLNSWVGETCTVNSELLRKLLDGTVSGGIHYVGYSNTGAFGVIPTVCADCRTKGGTNKKPEFWNY